MDISTNFSHNHIISMVAYKGQNKTESSFLNKIEPHFFKKKKLIFKKRNLDLWWSMRADLN